MAVRTRARRRRRARHPPAADREPRARGHQRRRRPRCSPRSASARSRAWNPSSIPRVAGSDGGLARPRCSPSLVALVTTVIFSLAPAARLLRPDLTDAMKEGGGNATTGGGRRRFRNALVVAEMALAVVLLVGAGLMLRTLWSLQRIDLGFNPSGVLTMRISLPAAAYRGAGAGRGLLFAPDGSQLRAVPGVIAAGAARSLPLGSHDRRLRPLRGRLRPAAGHEREGGLADRHRRLHGSDGRAGRPRPRHRGDRHRGRRSSSGSSTRRWRGSTGRDAIRSAAASASAAAPTVRGSRSSASSEPSATTASPSVVKEKFYIPHTQWHKSLGNPTDPLDDAGAARRTAIPSALTRAGARRHPPDGSEPAGGGRADDGRGRRDRRWRRRRSRACCCRSSRRWR